jgi:hypothetical protein
MSSATAHTEPLGVPTSPPQSLDLTGLPAPVVEQLQRLVQAMRENLPTAQAEEPSARSQESHEEWAARLREWAGSHPIRSAEIDDDRESIYAGRGE